MVHHIDTYYYSVTIKDDCKNSENENMLKLISVLQQMKEYKQANPADTVEFADQLEITSFSFSIYQYNLQVKENFDIFIAKNIMTDETPRICVQIRSRALILMGEFKAIEESFKYVKLICDSFDLKIDSCLENRVDYAYHTNLIQRSTEYLSTEYLKEHLKSSMKLFHLIGNIGDELEINTLQIGVRSSNSVFFRFYNKSREVIEKNYKSFFFERWFQKGLISKYDLYVYKRAFELKSYVTGVLIGRCEWYIQYGNSENLKSMLRELITKCYQNSDNAPFLEKKIKGILPPVTVINNIEFQTKRAFYSSFDKCIKEFNFHFTGTPELKRVYKILYLRKEFLDFLTSKVVLFVDGRKTKKEKYTEWWSRIRSCKLDYTTPKFFEIYRSADHLADEKRAKRRLLNAMASFVVTKNGKSESFTEDIRDTLSSLNDNDIQEVNEMLKSGKLPSKFSNFEYPIISARTERKLKPIYNFTKEEQEKKENESKN